MRRDIKRLIIDVDGVLIEADGNVRYEKYACLFRWGLELVNSPEYGGSTWMFQKLKEKYDIGVEIDPSFYKLINANTPEVLAKLSKRFELYACSLASEAITEDKLKATKIDGYFMGFYLKPFKLDDKTIAVVDDRKIDYGSCFFIKFDYGQYKTQTQDADLVIQSLKELLEL